MNTKKKILFLITQSEFGGAQRFIYTFITNLKDYDIIVGAGPDGDDKNGLLFDLEQKGIKTKHLKYLRRKINPFFDFLALFEIKKILKEQKPDILFLCSSKTGFLGSLAGKNKIKRIIYRIGGWTFNDPWPKWKKKLYILIEKISAKWKDYIINNAESDKQQAIKLGIKAKKNNLLIYNGIGWLKFLPRQEARQKLINLISNLPNSSNQAPNSNDKLIGCIANDYPSKGFEYLIEASKELSNFKFIIIGKTKRKNRHNVFFLGGVSNAYKYLKAFDVFVLPSVKEGFPWTILEALKAEISIVATCVGAVPEIINDCIEQGNVQELIKAIKNPKKFKFNESFALEKMIKEYEKLFQEE